MPSLAAKPEAKGFAKDTFNVAIIAWDNMDLTDFVGPVETFSHAVDANRQRLFYVTSAAETDLTPTSQGVTVARDADIESLLRDIAEYDVLVVPGGGGFSADSIPKAEVMSKVIEAFMALPQRPEKPRTIMSICAGAFYLANAGLLKGKCATAHPLFLGELKKLCDRHGGSNVVRQHYVDCGTADNGTRIITSGGITSGFDSTLYLVEREVGLTCAEAARDIMDTNWRREILPFGFA